LSHFGLEKAYVPDRQLAKEKLPDIYALTYEKERFVAMYKETFTTTLH